MCGALCDLLGAPAERRIIPHHSPEGRIMAQANDIGGYNDYCQCFVQLFCRVFARCDCSATLALTCTVILGPFVEENSNPAVLLQGLPGTH